MIINRTENGVKNIQTAGYNGERTVSGTHSKVNHEAKVTKIRKNKVTKMKPGTSESTMDKKIYCKDPRILKDLRGILSRSDNMLSTLKFWFN